MSRPVIIIGCGGHSRVVAASLRCLGKSILAYSSLDPENDGKGLQADVCTDEDIIARFTAESVDLVLGIGPTQAVCNASPLPRIVQRYRDHGFRFSGVRHPFSWIADGTRISETAQIHAGAVIQPGVSIGDFSIVNTRASVDHDCSIGSFCHIAPGATLCGTVTIHDRVYVGAGSTIIQGIQIEERSFIGAGACVVGNVASGATVRGVPARPFIPKSNS